MKSQIVKPFLSAALAAFIGAALSGSAFGATPTVLQNDSSRKETYWTDNRWSPAVAPGNANAANYDFIVKNAKTFWLGYDANGGESTKTATFPGASLQLGADDFSSAGYMSCKGDKSTWTFNDLRLYKGYINNAGNNWYAYKGNATVYSKSDDPFDFRFRGDKDSYFYMKLTGNEDNVIKISHSTSGDGANVWVMHYGDQSATYSGSWVLGQNAHFRPYTTTGYNNSTSAQVFGKPLTTLNPAALVMKKGSILRYEANDRQFKGSDKRGLTIDAPGGQASYMVINGNSHHFGWPITGQGTFNVTGSGYFHLYSSCTVPLKASSANIYIRSGASVTGEYTDTSGRPMYVLGTVNGGPVTPARIGGTIADGLKIALGFDKVTNVTTTTDFPLVIVDRNASRTLTADDFDPWGIPGYQTYNAEGVVLSTNGDGDTVVSVRLVPYISSKVNPRLNNGSTWNGGSVPTAGHNYYVIAGTEFRTGGNDGNTTAVPGDKWVFGVGSNYQSKEGKVTFPFVRLLDGVIFNLAQSADATWEFAGNIDIRQTVSSNATFSAAGLKGCKVSANLSGRGAVWAKGTSKSYHYNNTSRPVINHWIEFSGNSSGYVGTFLATNSSYVAEAGALQLKASSETNFGGNPEKFSAAAWQIGNGVVFVPTADVTFDDANRGVTFLAGSSVDTASGDFTVKTPVVFKGAFEKRGAGTFTFGEGGVTFGTGAAITVGGGTLKAVGSDALKDASVSFADGAVLAVDASAGPLDLTTTTLSKAGAQYLVRIDGFGEPTTVATFADAASASAFVAAAKTIKGDGLKCLLRAEGSSVKAYLPGVTITVR